jgi:hypothetical protein
MWYATCDLRTISRRSRMSHTFIVPDEQYTRLEEVARQKGISAGELFRTWLTGLTGRASNLENDARLHEIQAHWSGANPGVDPPTISELRDHPLLQAAGIFASASPGWGDKHDDIIAEEALDPHADE